MSVDTQIAPFRPAWKKNLNFCFPWKEKKKQQNFWEEKKKAQKLNSNIRLQYRRPQTNCGGGSNFWSVRLRLSKTDLPCFYDKSFRFEKWHIFYHWSTVIHEREFSNQSNSISESSIIWKQPQNSEDIQSGYLSWIILSERSFHWGESFLHFRFYNFPQIITLAKASRAALRRGLRCGAGAWLLLLTHTKYSSNFEFFQIHSWRNAPRNSWKP